MQQRPQQFGSALKGVINFRRLNGRAVHVRLNRLRQLFVVQHHPVELHPISIDTVNDRVIQVLAEKSVRLVVVQGINPGFHTGHAGPYTHQAGYKPVFVG